MSNQKFQNQLKQGHKYELKSLEYLTYDRYDHDTKYRKEYDLIIYDKNKKIKVEVKSDRQASYTDNMAIEFSYNHKPSGITATEADLWVYFIVHQNRDECYIFPIEELKEMVKKCRKVRGGDGNKSEMYLLGKHKCRKYLTQIKEKCSEREIMKDMGEI